MFFRLSSDLLRHLLGLQELSSAEGLRIHVVFPQILTQGSLTQG